ncbi:MAG: hypothetical protein JSU03_02950 [Bacteroidetes bacterium]|nr:hypothetical protein [Bacteroidota bacterium]MBS1756215.1 hypothetical protein [Bacteroidota bacterium]
MATLKPFAIAALIIFSACSTPKSYFTADVKNAMQQNGIPFEKLQYYIDKDVELKRELSSSEGTRVSSGKVIMENGKYLNIITLKKGTPGVCTGNNGNSLNIAFESGYDKNLGFALPLGANSNSAYTVTADKWLSTYNSPEIGKITYDGKVYFMRFAGAKPKLMIKKSAINKYEVDKRTMRGRKL